MPLLTLLGRVHDGMPLAGTQDSHPDLGEFQRQAKAILNSLTHSSPARSIISSPPYVYYYVIEDAVCYICMCDPHYPAQLAYQYLEQVQHQFMLAHGDQVNQFSRPYAAIAFDTRLNRLRREFLDPRSSDNIAKLNANLTQVHNVMRSNMNEILKRGEHLSSLEDKTVELKEASKKYLSTAKWAAWTSAVKAWAPIIIVVCVIMIMLYVKLG
ncbi:Vesicle-trafficking protein SEC22b [Plasmodiophora brassicae]|nr:hypothetical protein PBRA_003569 [Plasmodiophora brassicae]